jgi:hypothetical protein
MRTRPNTTLPKKKPFIPHTSVVLIAGYFACLCIPATAEAGVVLDIQQVAGNVVATATGTVDLSALSIIETGTPGNGMLPAFGVVQVGTTLVEDNVWGNIAGPASFGPGTGLFEHSSSHSGDFFGVAGKGQGIEVSTTYVSGAPLSGTATWADATFSSLGLTPGTYNYTWGSGPTADTLTVNIVPEPASLWLGVIGSVGVIAQGWSARSRKQRTESLQGPFGAAG